MRIFIAGLGYCGSAAAQRLRQAGHSVIGLNRSGVSTVEGLPCLAGDVLADDGLRVCKTLEEPVDGMICALSGSRLRDPAAYRALYVDGPRRVADALPWVGPRRIWYLGSTGVYGVTDGSWVDEETPAIPLHENGAVQLQAEAALRDTADQLCVLRLSGLYGPGRIRLVRQALRRRPFFKPDLWSNQIHRDDVAGVLAFLVDRQEAPPPLLLVSDDQPVLRREIFEWVRARSGHPEGLYDEDHPAGGLERGNKRICNQLLRSLGVVLAYPGYREALEPLLD